MTTELETKPETTGDPAVVSSVLLACVCCGDEYCWRWTDTHGIAVCHSCGLPYRILHYEGEGDAMKRVEKPPEPAIDEPWIAVCKRYWQSKKRMVVPGIYDIGPLRRFSGATYSGATEAHVRDWNNWCKRHKSELPQQANADFRDAEK